MVIAQNKNKEVYKLVYNESALALDKADKLIFIASNEKENFDFKVVFEFNDDGEALSTTYWAYPETNMLYYQLHKWEYPSWIEISKPVVLNGDNLNGQYLMKFRSSCSEGTSHRRMEVSIWKDVTKSQENV